MSDRHPKLILIHKQPDDQIVHTFRFGETDRPAYQPLDPRAQVDVLALDLLRVCLAHRVLRGRHMALIGFVNLLRLQLSLDTRIFHSGPTCPLSSPLRPRNLRPTLESFPHLLAVVRRR